jgi:hypothetical protein
MAVVTTLYTDGSVNVKFDGESIASSRKYYRLQGTDCLVNDRVVMLKAGSTWVVSGVIATASNYGSMRHLARSAVSPVGGGGYFANNDTWVNQGITGLIAVPAGARCVNIAWTVNASSGANAAAYWRHGVWWNNTTINETLFSYRVHNNGAVYSDLGVSINSWWNVSNRTDCRPYIDVNVDGGGGAFTVSPSSVTLDWFA